METYLRELKPYILFITFLFLGAFLFGYMGAYLSPEEAGLVQAEFAAIENLISDLSAFSFFFFILLNNALKIFLTVLLGAGFGILPVLFVFLNGYVIGVFGFISESSVGWPVFLLSILPHGIIELPAFIIAAAAGYMIGAKVLKNIFRGAGYPIKEEVKKGINLFFKFVLPLLLIAAFVEVFITPVIINLIK